MINVKNVILISFYLLVKKFVFKDFPIVLHINLLMMMLLQQHYYVLNVLHYTMNLMINVVKVQMPIVFYLMLVLIIVKLVKMDII